MAGPTAGTSFGTGVTGAGRDAATEAQVDPAPGVLAPVPEPAETRHRGGGTQVSRRYGDTQVSLWYGGTQVSRQYRHMGASPQYRDIASQMVWV